MKNEIKIYYSEGWEDYELLDTGEGEKLERFGPYAFVRPYEEAMWPKSLGSVWENAEGKFWSSKAGAKAGWKMKGKIAERWEMQYKGIKLLATPTPFRHLAFFPEQAPHWDFIEQKISAACKQEEISSRFTLPGVPGGSYATQKFPPALRPRFLNLFGYTGVASLFALRGGAEVTHLDASKQILKWAKENQELNEDLKDLSMRIIEDDAVKFLEREIKRGNKYDAVIMDPPKFGRGPKGEVWKLEDMMPKLIDLVRKILSDKPIFVILTSYATESSSLSLGYALGDAMKELGGTIEQGELCVLEKSSGRLVSLSNTAVWEGKY